jgi:hypothetical protein
VTIQYLLGGRIGTDFNRAIACGRLLLLTERNQAKVNRNQGTCSLSALGCPNV